MGMGVRLLYDLFVQTNLIQQKNYGFKLLDMKGDLLLVILTKSVSYEFGSLLTLLRRG